MDHMYFVSTNDKPVKLVLDNQDGIFTETEIYKLSLYEVLKNELRWNWKLRINLTKQQIHTERGKLKRGLYNEVINFLVKRGVTKEYIDNEVNQERERTVFTKLFNMSVSNISNSKFGIISLHEN